MKIYKNKSFSKFAFKESISDAKLREAVKDAENGKIYADYGGGVIKQRISRRNEGKSGGYRSIILYRQGERAFFVHGFSKNAFENITENDVRKLKELAKITFSLSETQIENLVKTKTYIEVNYDE
jgi:hypothetical protein